VAKKVLVLSGFLAVLLGTSTPWITQAASAKTPAGRLSRTLVQRPADHFAVSRHDLHLSAAADRRHRDVKSYGTRYGVAELTPRLLVLSRVIKDERPVATKPKPSPTPTPVPTATAAVTPTPTPTPAATATAAASGNQLIMTPQDVSELRARVAAGTEPYASAWSYFRDGRAKSALNATPNVDVGPTTTSSYVKLDTDSRYARNLAVAYACTGDAKYASKARAFLVAWASGNHPAPYSYTKDYQGGYHQSYGAFSFAFAYDLTRDSGVYSAGDDATIQAWFRTWAAVMKGYQDNFAGDYWFSHTGRDTYSWPGTTLTYDRTDYYTGRDTAAAPAVAWLAAAIVSDDAKSISTLYSATYRLNVPEIMHCSCNPDNDGDSRTTTHVPQVLIKAAGYYDNPNRGGCLDYMSYNARLASILYEMTANLGRATATMATELRASWSYLSQFAGPEYLPSPAPNDLMHWDLFLSRIQSAVHIFGASQFQDDVDGGQYSRAKFYESQFLGPTTLTQS